ncbi:MAG: PepSY domain-containing protein [Sphingomonadaceae bacterium]|nr:PepSY domain-containing protein [Sphingomonadaceae bacterium]
MQWIGSAKGLGNVPTPEINTASAASDERRSPANGNRKRPRVRRGKLWFRIHSLVGLNLSLLIGLICLTGTLAVFASEVDWLMTPSIRAAQPVALDDTNWQAIAASLAEHAPDDAIDTIETGPSSAFAPAAYTGMPDGGRRVIRFDPATGVVQGEHSTLGFKSLLRAIHSHLLIGGPGLTIVTLTAFFLLASLVTALFAYRRWWRGFFRWPQRHRGARVFWGDFHRLAGLWSLVFGFVVALTGIWYFAEQNGVRAPAPDRPALSAAKVGNVEAAAYFPKALAAAHAAYPDLAIRRIDWPGRAGEVFAFYGQEGTVLVRPRANAAAVDVRSGDIAFTHSGSDAGVHRRISEAADPLHMGYFAGFWSKLLWFLSGALLTIVAVSGAIVYAKRLAGEGDGHVRLRNLAITLALPLMTIGAMVALLPGTIAALG